MSATNLPRSLRFRRRLTSLEALGTPGIRRFRNAIQVAIAAFLLYSGWQFYLFVEHFNSGGQAPYVPRPAAVEAFLPLSALVALRAWLGTGVADNVHPAGVVILLAAVFTALLFGKGLCSWLCPVGALSEALWRLGRRVCGRSFSLPKYLDWTLQAPKYLLLFFFVKAIFFDMSAAAASYFLQTSYNKVADVKMLYFFLQPGAEVVTFLGVLAALSLVLPNLWCRYLCPYGALLGLLSILAPFKVTRDDARCTGCRRCTRACPERLIVHEAEQVDSPSCSRCLDCVQTCPRAGALYVGAPRPLRLRAVWAYPALFLGTFFVAILVAQVAGYWQSSLTYDAYVTLLPKVDALSHP